MYTYNLCEFNYGYEGQFYQKVDGNGFVTYVSLIGEDIQLVGEYGYFIIGVNVIPPWV